ncbi:MAG: hypothetical protein K5849_05540 [Bacteroidales bacterium]|nr:hypothetical protein [Bacteroidales bacterium]
MRKWILLFCLALASGWTVQAQTKSWSITETGWGRVELARTYGSLNIYEGGIREMNIPRWRTASGTLRIDYDKREASLSVGRKKEKTFLLLTESRPFTTRDGWSYVEYESLDERNSGCRFLVCTHESGAERLLILYPFSRPDTIYGYRLTPES